MQQHYAFIWGMRAYTTYSLNPEQWSDAYLAQQADAHEPGSTKYYQSSNQYRIISKSYQASHYEASGALIISGNFSSIPFNYTQSDAYNFALSQVQNNGGLPSDAVLTTVITHYRHDPSGTVIMGYTFIWRHQNGMGGGDYIAAIVDNQQRSVCTSIGPCGGCNGHESVYDMRVNYLYRLWRTIGSPTAPTSGISSRQALAIAATQTKLKGTVGDIGAPVGYVYSYWSPPFYSLDNTAYPVYRFVYTSGAVVFVDARTGKVVGVASSY